MKDIIVLLRKERKKIFRNISKSFFWFSVGAFLALFFIITFGIILFQKNYSNVVYPGVMINGINFGEKTQEEVKDYFTKKNQKIAETKFVLYENDNIATFSAQEIDLGYDGELLSQQAFQIGRSKNILSNVSLIVQAYINGINLAPSYRFSEEKLITGLNPLKEQINIEPVEALFTFENGKVKAFQPSKDGQEIDIKNLEEDIINKTEVLLIKEKKQTIKLVIPIKVKKPNITTDKANNLGIKELIGSGTSLFQHSIENRIYNVTLAATRLNGILIAPNEIFSFNKAVGDISAFTGYKQAYVIQNGRTVLGDGGGVCQVSTTIFRAALNTGLPILERHAHAYRVSYYEQDSGPGIDATVYSPSIDFKFKNDTGNYILVQTIIDPTIQRLTFNFYGTKDGRFATVSKPVILSQSPPPPPLYQDDPNLPKGQTKQIDFPASGANVYFTREVKKDGKTIINDKFVSNYRAWQAIYLRGTKE